MGARSGQAILIAASGSGGHLLPAVYIARAIKRQSPSHEIAFVGSGRPLEEKLIDPEGFPRHIVTISGIKRTGLVGKLRFLLRFPAAVCATWGLISRVKPAVVVGVGGYVSVLPVLLARLRGIPTWIHEAELHPGLANHLLSYVTSKISLAFESSRMPCARKTVYTGHPVREQIRAIAPVQAPSNGVISHLLVMGGSQGADAVDRAMVAVAPLLRERGIEVWHQSRVENVEFVRRGYSEAGVTSQVVPFIDQLPEAYRWAHLIVSRAGAGAVMEISAVNIPAILIPLPATQIGQADNARFLERLGKALVVPEGEAMHERLQAALRALLEPARYAQMKQAAGDQRALDAADRIAAGVLSLA